MSPALSQWGAGVGQWEGGAEKRDRELTVAQSGCDVVVLGKNLEGKGRGKKFQLEGDNKYAIFFLHNASVGGFCLLKFT